MDDDFVKLERELKENSQNSTESLIRYILFEMQSPIEDYLLAINLLAENYPRRNDIRIAILGAYLSSTWLSFKKNIFLEVLDKYLAEIDNQNKAIIYYLHAYDIYLKCDEKYPPEYSDLLRKSIAHSNRFVYNYVRLSEITDRKESFVLLNRAVSNVETIWTKAQLEKAPMDIFLEYDNFVDEFILGVDISIYEYKELLAKRDSKR